MIEHLDGVVLLGAAVDGAQAVELVEQTRPDVILLDIAMPVMDGLEAAAAIRTGSPGVKIAMFSAYSRGRMEAAAIAAGADAYLQKTSDLDELIDLVHRLFPDRPRPTRREAADAPRPQTAPATPAAVVEQRYRLLLDALDEAVLVLDGSESVLAANFAAARTLDITTSRLMGRRLSDCGFEVTPRKGASLPELVRSRRPASHVPVRQRRGDGSRHLLASVRPLGSDGPTPGGQTLISLVDVTDLESARDRYRALAENLPGTAAMAFDRRLRFTTVAGCGAPDTVGDAGEIVGRSVRDLGLGERGRLLADRMTASLAGVPQTCDLPGLRDATIWSCQFVPVHSSNGEVEGGMLVARDVTEERAAETAIRQSEERFREAVDLMMDPALIIRPIRTDGVVVDFRIIFANRAARDVVARYGAQVEDRLWSDLPRQLRRDEDLAACREVLETGEPQATYALMPEPSDAGWGRRGFDLRLARIDDGVLVTYQDVAARREVSETERRVERLRSVLTAANRAVLCAGDERDLLQAACEIVVEHGGFRLAWACLIDDTRTVHPVAAAGVGQDYIPGLAIKVEDGARSRGPTGTAMRTGRHVAMNDIEADPRMAPWRAEALKRGFGSSGAFPLRRGKECVGALAVYAAERGYFGDAEIVMLDQLAAVISNGMTDLARQDDGISTLERP